MVSATQELEAAFISWKDGLNSGDLDAFWQAFHDGAEILDEDFPWRMSKEDFITATSKNTLTPALSRQGRGRKGYKSIGNLR